MHVLLTGSSGRVGRAIFNALTATGHTVSGFDRSVFATTRWIADVCDRAKLSAALEGADAVIHTAALHAPHVGLIDEAEFTRINVDGTRCVAEEARRAGVKRFVFTSTTALYGHAIAKDRCTWIDEETLPEPRTIYHRTKLAAEAYLKEQADPDFRVTTIRMSRCFPERADLMAMYRLHRGVDVRDVASAHMLALDREGAPYRHYVISGSPPFERSDCEGLANDPRAVLGDRAADALALFEERGWQVPPTIDRVYSTALAEADLGWRTHYGFEEVARQLDRGSLEVLPPAANVLERPE